jgi:hypothetical protein
MTASWRQPKQLICCCCTALLTSRNKLKTHPPTRSKYQYSHGQQSPAGHMRPQTLITCNTMCTHGRLAKCAPVDLSIRMCHALFWVWPTNPPTPCVLSTLQRARWTLSAAQVGASLVVQDIETAVDMLRVLSAPRAWLVPAALFLVPVQAVFGALSSWRPCKCLFSLRSGILQLLLAAARPSQVNLKMAGAAGRCDQAITTSFLSKYTHACSSRWLTNAAAVFITGSR